MRNLVLLLFILRFIWSFGQDTYKTYYGDQIYPIDTFRTLNFFINIIYDSCPTCNPVSDNTPNWMPDTVNSINVNPPVYLDDWMDSDFDPDNIHARNYLQIKKQARAIDHFRTNMEGMVFKLEQANAVKDVSDIMQGIASSLGMLKNQLYKYKFKIYVLKSKYFKLITFIFIL